MAMRALTSPLHPSAAALLLVAADALADELKADAAFLRCGGDYALTCMSAGETLPRCFSAQYTAAVLERLARCAADISARVADDPHVAPGCVAEQICLHATFAYASDHLEAMTDDPEYPALGVADPWTAGAQLAAVAALPALLGESRSVYAAVCEQTLRGPLAATMGWQGLHLSSWFEAFDGSGELHRPPGLPVAS